VNGIRIVPSAVADFHLGMSLPFVLQRQLPDLGVQALDVRSGVALVGCGGKYLSRALQQLGSPLADLVGVDLELLGKLDQGPVPPDCGQGHLRFERR